MTSTFIEPNQELGRPRPTHFYTNIQARFTKLLALRTDSTSIGTLLAAGTANVSLRNDRGSILLLTKIGGSESIRRKKFAA